MSNESVDYTTIIDRQTWSFIDQTNAWYPPDTIDAPVERQREIYNAMCREFFAGYPADVTATDEELPCGDHVVPLRRYRCSKSEDRALLLYIHGGGFVVGGLASHDDVCAELCHRTGLPVTSVDYRLSPEHQHPAAFNDALAAFHHIAEHEPLPIVLCGDSAGGNLAAAVAGETRDHSKAAVGQLLIYPGLGGETDRGSYVRHAEAPMLTTREVLYYQDIYAGCTADIDDPTLAPLRDTSFHGLPPTVVITAELRSSI